MKPGTKELYHAQEFARLAGVTVRALHHYDRLGLLKPKQRTRAGYRLYTNRDFARLEQIVVLKFLGMPLKQIRSLLAAESRLSDALHRQRVVLAEKRMHIDRAIFAIRNAQDWMELQGEPDWRLLRNIIREIEMEKNMDWTKKYYSEQAQEKVEERKKLWSPELQERVSREWAQLFADIGGAIGAGEAPTGAKAQALAGRWRKLLEGFTGGDPEIQKGLNKMWADQASWPDQTLRAYKIKPEMQEFIMKAMRAGK